MNRTSTAPAPDDLALLSRLARQVARARRMSTDDTEDFAQSVQVRLAERDYDIFHRFSGRSTLQTYLRVVVNRMFLDWLNSTYGKWRPSVAAVRLGEHAVRLDRAINRDRYTVDEAVAMIAADCDAPPTADLRRLADQLPRRLRRRRATQEDLSLIAGPEFQDPVEAAEDQQNKRRIAVTLADALQALPPEEQQMIQLRFMQRRSVQSLAHMFESDPKSLYRRFERTLRSLRRSLLAAGVTGSATLALPVGPKGTR